MVSSSSLRIGMAGTGNICMQHAAAVRRSLRGGEITALFNRSKERLEAFPAAFESKFGMPLCESGECALFTDFDAMLDSGLIDALYVTVPHRQHVDFAIRAVRRGIHCMIEKPLDISLKKALELRQACEESGAVVSVVAQSRFYAAVERMHRLFASGEECPVTGLVNVLAWRDENYYGSNAWRGSWEGEGGGVLVNQSVHELDLLCHFLGEVSTVYGIWRNVNHPYIEVDDTAQAVVTFKSGAVANVIVSNSVNPAYRNNVMICCRSGNSFSVTTHEGVEENAGLAAYDFSPYNDVFTTVTEEERAAFRSADAKRDGAYANGSPFPYFSMQYDDFAEAVIRRDPSLPRSTISSAMGCMDIFRGIYLSSELKRPLTLEEIRGAAE